MLTVQAVQSFSFKMSVKNLGFPLPIKIEEDQKLFIDLDTEGSSPEDIVIEWHLEIRRFFGSYSAASGEIKLVSIMKEYITAITERAIHFEDIVRLQEMVEHHMEHIYWFYQDSDICFSDMYLDYMEHIMTFYVNLTLRVLLVLKKKIKVTQKKVMDMTQKVIKRLSFYLLQNEYHIFHVLIRQTTTLVDGMIKDVMNILNSNICKQMFRNLYMHFLVLTPVRDMSDEAFCRAFILFENWKAFEDYKQDEKIDECIKNIFNRDVRTIRDNEFLSKILTPKASIMSELMKVMGCDPSITKAYFDYIKSKQKADGEIIDDIGKLALEDALLTETELVDEEDDEEEYIEFFHTLMGDAKYNLNEVVLDCKSERNSSEAAVVNEDAEILVLDTDSDSDVEIVSIIPSQNSLKRMSASPRRSRNPATNSQPVTSFLESISVDVDTARRKYGFRTLGNTSNSQQNKTPETSQTPTPTLPSIAEEQTPSCPNVTETCLILDDDICETTQDNSSVNPNKDHPMIVDTNETVTNIVQDEIVRNIVQDETVTKVVQDETVRNLVQDEIVRNIVQDETVTKVVQDETVTNLVQDESVRKIVQDESVTNILQDETVTSIVLDETFEKEETSRTNNVAPTNTEDSSLSISEDLSSTPVEIETSEISNAQPVDRNKIIKDAEPGTLEVSSSPERKEDSVSKVTETLKEVLPVPKTNGAINHVNRCPQLLQAPELDVVQVVSPTTPENVKVVVERILPLEEFSEGIMGTFPEDIVLEETVGENDLTEVGLVERGGYVDTSEDLETDFERLSVEPAEVVIDSGNPVVEVEQSSLPVPDIEIDPPITENCELRNASSKIDAFLTEPEQTDKVKPIQEPENLNVTTSGEVKEVRVDNKGTDDSNACHRTLVCDESPEIQNCDVESEVLDCRTEPTQCESGCGREETIERVENNVDFPTDAPSRPEEITPLDTGQDLFVRSLDTGQFDPNSPASPDPVDVASKPPNDKNVPPLLRKGQPHGEFGYPTPPGSEEEREKDSDEQTQLIYSNILPTKSFSVDASPVFDNEQVTYEALTPKNVQGEDFLCEDVEVDCVEISTADAELMERLSDEEKDRNASPSLGKSYEQIVKDAVGSQNSTEDEDDDTHVVSKKVVSLGKDGDEDISFDDMEQFLKNCDNDDYPQTSRKKRKRPREKTTTCARSPKRVKINEKPEMHFIPTSYDENSKDDVWGKQNEYDSSSSSSDNDETGPSRSKAKRRPSPMPLSKYLSKRNGANTHIPLSGRLTPDKPPPLKGILKRIEQKHTYHPLHNVDDEPETVVIVLHQREIGRGKRGSVEVKVYRKSFSAYKIPFDDHKLCHHAFVKLDEIKTDAVDVWGRVSVRTRVYEEELFNQPEKPMYKIVFDKNTPQLNSNDRKYYCDPSISSDSTKPKSTLYESENEQGIKKKRSYVKRSTKNQSDDGAKPAKRGRKPKSHPSDTPSSPKRQREVSPKYNYPVPATLEEALSTYADFYRKEEEEALLENNFNNRARSLHRIVKRFEQAIKQHRLGKEVDVEKLPVPPGYPPFSETEWESKMAPKSASRSTSEKPKTKRKPYQKSSEDFTNKKIKPQNITER
ncbi:uncharacterized protein LOC123322823 isoform X2 [Coccinella septempunctata]|uniref:uncharacterized protein LOC123322823 isoform X2 n=1 Tax=Coccinella septempunctata TaxID=41139 RepID=UPI001D05E4C1|nr:uncharacterized protein LOC123322823 isoform X2 [Coccinella septempunctata]